MATPPFQHTPPAVAGASDVRLHERRQMSRERRSQESSTSQRLQPTPVHRRGSHVSLSASSPNQAQASSTLLPSPGDIGTKYVEAGAGRLHGETRVRTQSASRDEQRGRLRDRFETTVFFREPGRAHETLRVEYPPAHQRTRPHHYHGLDDPTDTLSGSTTLATTPDGYDHAAAPGIRLSVPPFEHRRQYFLTSDAPTAVAGGRRRSYADAADGSTSSTPGSDTDSESGRVPYDFVTAQDFFDVSDDDRELPLNPQTTGGSAQANGVTSSKSEYKIKAKITHRKVSHARHGSEKEAGSAVAPAQLVVHEKDIETHDQEPDHLFQWYDLEVEHLDFTHFKEAVLGMETLGDLRREELHQHLNDAQIRFERELRTLQGIKGRVMEASCSTEVTKDENNQILRKMTLMCLPFFYLGKYREGRLESLNARSTEHPLRTLLQSQFSHVPEYRDRNQAAWKLRPEEEKCFHVAQLWCLIIDDNLLITCSTMSLDTLYGSMIEIKPRPPVAEERRVRDPPIRVTDCCNRLWLFEIDECPTWLSFTAHFLEISRDFEEDFTLHLPEREIGAEHWDQVLQSAQTSSVRLSLRRRETRHQAPSKHAHHRPAVRQSFAMKSKQETRPNNNRRAPGSRDGLTKEWRRNPAASPTSADSNRPRSPVEISHQILDDFCIFAWPDQRLQGTSAERQRRVHATIEEAYQHLIEQENTRDRSAFQGCKQRPYADVNNWATAHSVSTRQAPTKAAKEQHKAEKVKLKIASAARDLFNFFLPLDSTEPLAEKFWGSLYEILEQKHRLQDLKHFCVELQDLARLSIHLSKQMYALSSRSSVIETAPREFFNACLHALMFLIHFKSPKTATKHFHAGRSLLLGGRIRAQNVLREKPLQEREAALPLGVLSLIVRRLLDDVTLKDCSITNTYFKYFARLDGQVRRDCLKRIHQEALSLLLQEIEVVIANSEDQVHVLVNFSSAMDQGTDDTSSGQGRGAVLVDECIRLSQDRLNTFRELAQQTRDLGIYNLNMIETNKDRQEQAVVAFTIVTIVFLPLSFVASFLGMNTIDIRESKKGEYLFWSSAVPLTTVILVCALHWTGEVNFVDLWTHFARWARYGFRKGLRHDDEGPTGSTAMSGDPVYSPPPPVTAQQNITPMMLRKRSSHSHYHATQAQRSWEHDANMRFAAQAFLDGVKSGEQQKSDTRVMSKELEAATLVRQALQRRRAHKSSLETLDEDSQTS